jgi:basic membrane lipoprotein Med (substrate-binding protein (PBP1-ABC) superfamily)
MWKWIARAAALVAVGVFAVSTANAQFELEGEPKIAMLQLATINDGGWSEALEYARVKTEDALGIEIAYTENVPEDNSEILRIIDLYVDRGYNIIIGTSWGYSDAFLQAAEKYPEIVFLNCAGETNSANLESFYARSYQGWYLAGIIAGHLTQTKKIGTIGGYPLGVVNWDLNGFLRGAQSVDPEIEMVGVFVNSWYDPVKETQAAEALLEQGVDVLGSNMSTPGPHLAFENQGKWSIGFQVDVSDQAPKAVASSMIYKWEGYLIPTIRSIVAGTWVPGEWGWWEGLDTGIFDVDPIADFGPVAAIADVEAARQAMIAGELDPFQGPLYRQDGSLAVPEGEVLSDDDLWGMTYFIQGSIGTMPTE